MKLIYKPAMIRYINKLIKGQIFSQLACFRVTFHFEMVN